MRTLTISTTTFERMKDKFYGFRQTVNERMCLFALLLTSTWFVVKSAGVDQAKLGIFWNLETPWCWFTGSFDTRDTVVKGKGVSPVSHNALDRIIYAVFAPLFKWFYVFLWNGHSHITSLTAARLEI